MKTVFIHPERCVGCKQCEAACAVAHSQSRNLFLAALERPAPKPRIHAEPGLALGASFPNKCRHCDPSPCLAVCPTKAIHRAEDRPKLVLVDVGKCIGCGMCAIVCPFDVVTYYPSHLAPDRGRVATKCDGCIDRQRVGGIPACVEACKAGALEFGDPNEIARRGRRSQAEVVEAAQREVEVPARESAVMYGAWREWGAELTRFNRQPTPTA